MNFLATKPKGKEGFLPEAHYYFSTSNPTHTPTPTATATAEATVTKNQN